MSDKKLNEIIKNEAAKNTNSDGYRTIKLDKYQLAMQSHAVTIDCDTDFYEEDELVIHLAISP